MALLKAICCALIFCYTLTLVQGNSWFPGFNIPMPGAPFGGGDKKHDEQVKKFTCPGIGKFAIKRAGKNNCRKYYDCPAADRNPSHIAECPEGQSFNRLSRTCQKTSHVNCKWCTKLGRHADITSKKHFLECAPGTIVIRYKCKKGKYDAAKKECTEKDWKVMDLTIDAEQDKPTDIEEYQKTWAEEDENNKAMKSLEQFGDATDSDEKDEKKKDDDDDDEDKKKKKKPKKDDDK